MRVRSAPIVVFLCSRIVIFRSRLRLPPRVVFDVDDVIDFAAGIVEQPNKCICILSILFYSILSCNINFMFIFNLLFMVWTRGPTNFLPKINKKQKECCRAVKINCYENIYSDVDVYFPAFVPRYKYLMFFAFTFV